MRMMIRLRDDERLALARLSKIERREPRAQAAIIIRQALKRRGYLQDTAVTNTQAGQPQGVQHDHP